MVNYTRKEMSELKELCDYHQKNLDPNDLYVELVRKLVHNPGWSSIFNLNGDPYIQISARLISLDGKEELLLRGHASQWIWKNRLERVLSRAYQNSLPIIVRGHYDVCNHTPSLFVEEAKLFKENNKKEVTKQEGKLSLAKTLEGKISLADGSDLSLD